jgi:hypothetical protein
VDGFVKQHNALDDFPVKRETDQCVAANLNMRVKRRPVKIIRSGKGKRPYLKGVGIPPWCEVSVVTVVASNTSDQVGKDDYKAVDKFFYPPSEGVIAAIGLLLNPSVD